jgi:Domain of unknown function (DUF3850)
MLAEKQKLQSKLHFLKCWPEFFEAIVSGRKRHDLRRSDDRSFSEGDQIVLQEFDPESQTYTGRAQKVRVTYITASDMPCALSEEALGQNFCILSIATEGASSLDPIKESP